MNKKNFLILFLLLIFTIFANATTIQEINLSSEKSIVVFFKTSTCPVCTNVEEWLTNGIEEKYPNVEIKRVFLETQNSYSLIQEFYKSYSVPINKQNSVPIIFVGENYYSGSGEIFPNLENQLEIANQNKILLKTDVENGIIEDEKKGIELNYLIGLALVDAVNPCELAVLIILMSVILSRYPKNKSKALKVGLAFTSGIFIVYFIFGILLRELFALINSNVYLMQTNFYLILGAVSILIGILNIKDGLNYGAGGFIMEVPQKWRPKMKAIIESTTSPIGAFFVGLIVAFFLTPCTTGPYLVFTGIISEISLINALPYLLIYMLIFVSPMIAITLIAYFGIAKVEDMGEWRERNITKLHLIAGILMSLIGIWLILTAIGLL